MYRPPLLSRFVPRFLLLCVLPTAALVAALFALGPQDEDLESVQDAEWLSLRSGPALLLARSRDADPESGGHVFDYGWRIVDVGSGRELQSTWYATKVRAGLRKEVLAAAGETVAYVTEDGLHLRNLSTGEDAGGAALSARLPGVALPLYRVATPGGGVLALEADDKRRWLAELATGRLVPLQPLAAPGAQDGWAQAAARQLEWGGADSHHCVSRVWKRPDGRTWGFAEVKTERHSDTRNWALGETQGSDGYGGLQGFKPGALRLEYASFLCDERTGRAAEFPGGGALVMQWLGPESRVALSRLSAEGALLWTWSSPVLHHPNCELEAFGHEGGFVVRIDGRLVSLDAAGRVRWQS